MSSTKHTATFNFKKNISLGGLVTLIIILMSCNNILVSEGVSKYQSITSKKVSSFDHEVKNLKPSKIVFWIGTNENQVFNYQLINLLSKKADLIVLRSLFKGVEKKYDYANIVEKIHKSKSDLPVLTYGWPSIYSRNGRIDAYVMKGFEKLDSSLILYPTKKILLGNVSKPEYRKWFVSRIHNVTNELGVDGIALDSAFKIPSAFHPDFCIKNPKTCVDFSQGMEKLFQEIKQSIGNKKIFYNGLWNSAPNVKLSDQVSLLPYADGAAIEYFGFDSDRVSKHASTFSTDIYPFLKIISENPQSKFLVFARSPWSYVNYQDEYIWQRYLYASYLLVMNKNTYFKYHASFQYPGQAWVGGKLSGVGGRSSGLDLYNDWFLNLGSPISSYQKKNQIYFRSFENGMVLVVPENAKPQSYIMSQPMYSPEGIKYVGEISIKPKQGLILLNTSPLPEKEINITFGSEDSISKDWDWAENLIDQNQQRFLRLTPPPRTREYEHDVLLDSVRSLKKRKSIEITARFRDKNSKILITAEVNDFNKKNDQVILELTSSSKISKNLRSGFSIPFRCSPNTDVVPYIVLGEETKGQNKWEKVILRDDDLSSSYSLQRWMYMRIIGSIDIKNIRIW